MDRSDKAGDKRPVTGPVPRGHPSLSSTCQGPPEFENSCYISSTPIGDKDTKVKGVTSKKKLAAMGPEYCLRNQYLRKF
ncbi:unnamed protein product [Caenorhabditis nigoni]